MKILLVEDDEPTAWALSKALSAHHYTVTTVADGQTGLELAQSCSYDLLLLDVLVPKMDGMTLCRQLRANSYQSPIILLTALDTKTDRVMGLDAGADDYIVKPFDIEELTARIRALLRRRTSTLPPILTWGDLQLDPSSNEVKYGEKPLRLTPTEYILIELFLLNPRRVFSRSVIIDRLWSDQDSPGEETITSHVKSLRRKLKVAGANADLIETVFGLGYRLKYISESEPEKPVLAAAKVVEVEKKLPQQQLRDSVAKIWDKFQGKFTAQVEVIAQASRALSEGELTIEWQQNAKQEAHRLAGSLGIFGFSEGSRLARQLEQLLQTPGEIAPEQVLAISELVGQLQQELTQPSSISTSKPTPVSNVAVSSSQLLVIDHDLALTEQIRSQGSAWNFQVTVAADLKTARNAIAKTPPDIILLNLTFADSSENGLTLLTELAAQTPQIPVVAFTGRDSLSDRVEVAHLGGRACLHKPVSTEQIFKTVTQVLNQAHGIEAKILVVDDDPVILATVSSLLQSWGMDVTTLEHPQRFLEVLAAEAPDLLVLDLEMPSYSGIDLCQVVRNDPQWSDLPVLFLTAHKSVELVNQAFAAGADDYISKPIVEQELVTRIINRLERIRQRHRHQRGQP